MSPIKSPFIRSTATVTFLTAAGLVLGFWSQMLVAARFGVDVGMDAYLAATTLPNLLSTILTTSLAAAFLPVYGTWRERDEGEARKIAGSLVIWTGMLCLAACVAGMLFSGSLVELMAPGLEGEAFTAAAQMQRWLLPVVLLVSVNQILSGIRYAEGRFASPLLIRISAPVFTLIGVLAFSDVLHVRVLVLATLCAHGLQTIVLSFGAFHGNVSWKHALGGWRHPAMRKALRMAGPLAAAMCLYKLGPAYERWLASGMGSGAIATLGYATRLTQAIQPVLISGIALSSFALMAKLVPRGDMEGVRAALEKGCGALFFASVPLAVLLFVFAEPVIGLAFERGAFTYEDTIATSGLFCLYALGLPAGAVGTVVGQAYYAFQKTRVPIIAGILDIALFAALGSLLAPRLGLLALPIAYLISFHATALLVAVKLERETGFPILPLFARPFLQSAAAAAAAAAFGWLLSAAFSDSYLGSVLCMLAGSPVYLILQHYLFRSSETARAMRALGGMLSRRSGSP